ncbi:uncharacterized protein LOC110182539 isoform X2 [Drosophila serrata]|uniref:uncharacterized protein LOC110182539 isoform X2 n=1 Tax=Drosophila serrata TaxID=7274 RepID=UPI000A1D1793|nr:uncharacterized protein LOC110182539 isoform X2 [Drosophila serrata]
MLNQSSNSNTLKLNTRTALAFLENANSPTGITTVTLSPTVIERDSEFCWVCLGLWKPHAPPGTTVTGTMRMRPIQLVMPRRSSTHPWPDHHHQPSRSS